MGSRLDPAAVSIVDFQGNALNINPQGSAAICPTGSQIITYSFGTTGISIAASATDVLTLSGSATRLIKVLYIEVMGTKTTAGQELVVLLKRSSLNSGGTILSGVGVPHDSRNPPQTTTINIYTANPTTLGTSANFLRTDRVFWPALATITAPSIIQWDFSSGKGQSIVLNGPNELLAINMQSGSVAGDTFFANIVWTEE